MIELVFYVIILVFVGLLIYNTYMGIYTCFNHYGWKENSNPYKQATISNITHERVQYTKNRAKIKTKISFSDGFYFITYKTNREYSFLIYKIFISDKLWKKIIDLAITKHNLSVDKFINNK